MMSTHSTYLSDGNYCIMDLDDSNVARVWVATDCSASSCRGIQHWLVNYHVDHVYWLNDHSFLCSDIRKSG